MRAEHYLAYFDTSRKETDSNEHSTIMRRSKDSAEKGLSCYITQGLLSILVLLNTCLL